MRHSLASGLLLFPLALAASCATRTFSDAPHPRVNDLWKEFITLPESRSMALAGNPKRVWVGAAVGNGRTQASADAAAMEECNRRRKSGQIVAPCRIYARGSEVVWDQRGSRVLSHPPE